MGFYESMVDYRAGLSFLSDNSLVEYVISLHTFIMLMYISREMDLLSMPSNTGSLKLVQWPLFLLSSKVYAYFTY